MNEQELRRQFRFRVAYLTGEKCPLCSRSMELMTPEGKVSGLWAYHMETTHGINHEILPTILREAESRFVSEVVL